MADKKSIWDNPLLKKLGKTALNALDSASNALNNASQKLDDVAQQYHQKNEQLQSNSQTASSEKTDFENKNTTKPNHPQIKAKKSEQIIINGVLKEYRGREKYLVIEEGVITISGGVFFGNKTLETVVFPDSLNTIEIAAFESCVALKSILGGKHIRWIKKHAFMGCRSLESVAFGPDLIYLDNEAFKDCCSLRSVSFSTNSPLFGLELGVFSGCSQLTEIQWPLKIHHIFESSIRDCPLSDETLKTLNTILEYSPKRRAYVRPAVIKSDSFIMSNSELLRDEKIHIGHCNNEADNKKLSAFVTALFNKKGDSLSPHKQEHFDYPYDESISEASAHVQTRNLNDKSKIVKNLDGLEILDGLYVEWDCLVGLDRKIRHLVIPDSIHRIGKFVANQCPELESVVCEGKIEKIEQQAFAHLTHLREIRFEDDVNIISDNAFVGCSGLETVVFEKGLCKLGNHVFDGCSSLKKIQFPGNLQEMGDCVFGKCSALEEIRLPESCLSIGCDLFDSCIGLKKVHLPMHLKCIPKGTFMRCYKLEEIEWPEVYREDGHDYPVVEKLAFMLALMDDCCEKFELRDGVMKRVVINLIDEDPNGVFQLTPSGRVGHLERIPQLMMNSTLNIAWETSRYSTHYEFQMNLIKTCLSLANIITRRNDADNRAERLFALSVVRNIQFESTDLTSSFIKLVLPFTIAETLYAIGGNGNLRQKQIYEIGQMAKNYIPKLKYEDSSSEDAQMMAELAKKEFFDAFLKMLRLDSDTPFLLSPHVWRNTLPILPENIVKKPANTIYIDCNYYDVIQAIQSLFGQYHMYFSTFDDFSGESFETWMLRLGIFIAEGTDDDVHLVLFSPAKVFPKNIKNSVHYPPIKPVIDICEHSSLNFVALLSPSQIDEIRDILAEYQLEEMLTDYSSGIRLLD